MGQKMRSLGRHRKGYSTLPIEIQEEDEAMEMEMSSSWILFLIYRRDQWDNDEDDGRFT